MSENSPFLHICILGFKYLEYWLNFPLHLPLEVKVGQFQKGQKASTKDPAKNDHLTNAEGIYLKGEPLPLLFRNLNYNRRVYAHWEFLLLTINNTAEEYRQNCHSYMQNNGFNWQN